MIGLVYDDDTAADDPEPPEAAPLRASIDAFTASLVAAHPCIFMRPPVVPVEDIAALLHMSLDHCRQLLAAYDSLVSTDARVDEDDDEHEPDDDIPF